MKISLLLIATLVVLSLGHRSRFGLRQSGETGSSTGTGSGTDTNALKPKPKNGPVEGLAKFFLSLVTELVMSDEFGEELGELMEETLEVCFVEPTTEGCPSENQLELLMESSMSEDGGVMTEVFEIVMGEVLNLNQLTSLKSDKVGPAPALSKSKYMFTIIMAQIMLALQNSSYPGSFASHGQRI